MSQSIPLPNGGLMKCKCIMAVYLLVISVCYAGHSCMSDVWMGHGMNTLSIFIAAKKWVELLFAVEEVHFFLSFVYIQALEAKQKPIYTQVRFK